LMLAKKLLVTGAPATFSSVIDIFLKYYIKQTIVQM
jgi:hypothetical protein